MSRTCTKCKIEKELTEFYKHREGKDGINNQCILCCKEYSKFYGEVNKEKLKKSGKKHNEYRKKWREKNKETIKQKMKIYHKNNKEKIKIRQKEYDIKNKEKKSQNHKEYSIKNREKINKYQTQYNKNKYYNNPEHKLKMIMICRLNALLKQKSSREGSRTTTMLGCSLQELRQYLEHQFKPEMSWENHGKIWEIDHIQPCSSFNLLLEKEQKKCFHYSNTQPLFKTTKIAKLFGYINEIGNREKSDRIYNESL